MEECPRYPGMVEEAIWAFSRMELNEAWYRRLQENRRVIAGQLDALALTMQDWGKGQTCLDKSSHLVLTRIACEVRERGLLAEQVHIYEDEMHRQYVTAVVSSKWGGGIPSKQYCRALERAIGVAMRLQRDARTILTREPVQITAFEDTCFDAISAVASETKEGASISGDNVAVFSLEEGRCCICLSDGMGSGPAANKESDMVVDLMEKFMEAGFSGEAAIRIMNSAMVLKGEDESYSTLDFAQIDLYTGELALTKIGAAASFVRHKGEVDCLASASLPAGASSGGQQEVIRRKLVHGDFLVMVTDGVLEYLHVKRPEEKVAGMIEEIRTDNAETLAQSLLERVLLFNGGHAPDDMTIVVTGIWEK
jgi:stage II sporulation protein E